MSDYYSIKWIDGKVSMIDQRLLPHEVKYNSYATYQEVAEAIKVMVVRGAPAIGASAAYGMVLAINAIDMENVSGLLSALKEAGEVLKAARPTAVNLSWAVDRVYNAAANADVESVEELRAVVMSEADLIWVEDADMCFRMAENAMEVTPDPVVFVHHCNTGALATVAYGTALGVIRRAHEIGKKTFAYIDETTTLPTRASTLSSRNLLTLCRGRSFLSTRRREGNLARWRYGSKGLLIEYLFGLA